MPILYCVVVGDKSPFPVDVALTETVGVLKGKIKEKNPNTIQCDARKLQLYLASEDGAGLSSNDATALQLDDINGYKMMDPTFTIANKKHFGKDFVPKEGEVYVLVVVPTESEQTLRHAGQKRQQSFGDARNTNSLKKPRIEASEPQEFPDLNSFVEAAEKSSLDVGTLVNLPKTAIFESCFGGMYIRREYIYVADLIKRTLESHKLIWRVLVVGSPGIGKSIFGVYLLMFALKEKRNVAYRTLSGVVYYFTWNDSKCEISKSPRAKTKYNGYFDGIGDKEALDYDLFDHAFVFASPRSQNYNEFVKKRCFKVYLNPWDRQECEKFAEIVGCDEEDWLRKYQLVGGKPRFIFEPFYDYDNLVDEVKISLPETVENLKSDIWNVKNGTFQPKHVLFTMWRDDEKSQRCILMYASAIVEIMLSTRLNTLSVEQIR
ncbi:hypothetical protein LEN26_006964 [Aphanomyces euteiches]|nr:hypothetical protein AeMF1_020012 [Aphanomyces euteiches]KAH9133850.1 hypothetical protein LEN26_006964 [Aphanomyces euteiches]KAH9182144.1 hypothetical protein AeNC1_015880 [Aphanomyces euteiches]